MIPRNTDDTTEKTIGCILAFLLFPVNVLLWGAVTLNMYNWFILPVFVSLPALSLVQTIGLRFFIATFTVTLPREKDNEDTYSASESAMISTALGLSLWGLAWTFHSWFM